MPSNRGVSLTQRLLITAPVLGKRMFHVEQGPIQKSASNLRAVFGQPVKVWTEDQRGQVSGHLFAARAFVKPLGTEAAVDKSKFERRLID